MANADTSITLDELHLAIEQEIRAQFPALKLVEFYREEDERRPPTADQLPACLLEMSEMEPTPDIDPGTEQMAVNARFEARLIIGFRTPKAKLEIRKLAAAFAVFARLKRWTLETVTEPDGPLMRKPIPTGPAEVTTIISDDFNPELDRYEVWRVEWIQPLHLGVGIWNDEGVTPVTPLYSWLPDIGTGNEEKYQNAVPEVTPGGGTGL